MQKAVVPAGQCCHDRKCDADKAFLLCALLILAYFTSLHSFTSPTPSFSLSPRASSSLILPDPSCTAAGVPRRMWWVAGWAVCQTEDGQVPNYIWKGRLPRHRLGNQRLYAATLSTLRVWGHEVGRLCKPALIRNQWSCGIAKYPTVPKIQSFSPVSALILILLSDFQILDINTCLNNDPYSKIQFDIILHVQVSWQRMISAYVI